MTDDYEGIDLTQTLSVLSPPSPEDQDMLWEEVLTLGSQKVTLTFPAVD